MQNTPPGFYAHGDDVRHGGDPHGRDGVLHDDDLHADIP